MPDNDVIWYPILNSIRNERCIPFLGAGASVPHNGEPGFPGAAELAADLDRVCHYPGCDKTDLLRVAQYFVMTFSDAHLVRQTISKKLPLNDKEPPEIPPTLIHRTLASLPIKYVLTTNYDNLMELAFTAQKKHPQVVSHLTNTKMEFDVSVDNPLVYKLHGTLSEYHSMVVTEDDVIDFLANLIAGQPQLPRQIRNLFEEDSILFIGYGLKDWNIRAMMRAMRGKKIIGRDYTASFAVQRRPDDEILGREWDTVVQHLRNERLICYNIDAHDFIRELKERYDRGEGL